MHNELFVELFRFNHKADYLPYYRKYNISYNENTTVKDLLDSIDAIEAFSYEGVELFGAKINELYVSSKDLVKDIVSKTSNSLIIEPASMYRAINDLSIKNSDFLEKLSILDAYLTDEQKENYFYSLQNIYYSSNTLNINKDYIGDHVLVAASDIISSNENLKSEILALVNDKDNGILYHTSLKNRVLNLDSSIEEKINKLLQEVIKQEEEEVFSTLDVNVKDGNFSEFNVAFYSKSNYDESKSIINKSGVNYINMVSKNNDMALYSTQIDKTFSYKIAGNILLEAKDKNADFIIVNEKKAFDIMDKKQSEIEKAVGREINIPVVTIEQFSKLLNGERDIKTLGFDTHKVAVSFI